MGLLTERASTFHQSLLHGQDQSLKINFSEHSETNKTPDNRGTHLVNRLVLNAKYLVVLRVHSAAPDFSIER